MCSFITLLLLTRSHFKTIQISQTITTYRRCCPLVSAALGNWNIWRCSSSMTACLAGWGLASCWGWGAVELVVPALPMVMAAAAQGCRHCQLKRILPVNSYKQGNYQLTEDCAPGCGISDGCLFNNLFAVTMLRICWSAIWQVFWDGMAWVF